MSWLVRPLQIWVEDALEMRRNFPQLWQVPASFTLLCTWVVTAHWPCTACRAVALRMQFPHLAAFSLVLWLFLLIPVAVVGTAGVALLRGDWGRALAQWGRHQV